MSFKSSFKGGQNMAPFIKATIGDDFSTGGEALPTSTSARIQPSKPVPRFSGGDAFCSTPPDMNQSQIKVPPGRRRLRQSSSVPVLNAWGGEHRRRHAGMRPFQGASG